MKTKRCFLFVVPLMLLWVGYALSYAQNADPVCTALQKMIPSLQRQTKVPVRLPVSVCEKLFTSADGPLYAVLNEVNKNGYSVTIGYSTDCNGAAACRYASIDADQSGENSMPFKEAKTKIVLANHITGYLFDSKGCATGCNTAIEWQQNGVFYTVGIKYGNVKDVLAMANAMVR